MTFQETIGKEFGFYGVDGSAFKIGKLVGSVEVKAPSGAIFFNRPVATVMVVAVEERFGFKGFHLVCARNGHVWLRLGTDHFDHYYPFFVFSYQPRSR